MVIPNRDEEKSYPLVIMKFRTKMLQGISDIARSEIFVHGIDSIEPVIRRHSSQQL